MDVIPFNDTIFRKKNKKNTKTSLILLEWKVFMIKIEGNTTNSDVTRISGDNSESSLPPGIESIAARIGAFIPITISSKVAQIPLLLVHDEPSVSKWGSAQDLTRIPYCIDNTTGFVVLPENWGRKSKEVWSGNSKKKREDV